MGAEGSRGGGRSPGRVDPMGSQRAVRSLPILRDHWHFLSSLTWKLYGASHLWLRPLLTSCLCSSRSWQLLALPAHLQPFCPAGSSRPPTKANPEGTHRLSTSLCLLLSLLLLLQDLSSFSSMSRRRAASLEEWQSLMVLGTLGVPCPSPRLVVELGTAALRGTAGARDVPGGGWQARAGPAG